MISSVSYGLSLPFLAGMSARFWQALLEMSSFELATSVALLMTLKLWLWFICYRRTFRWAGEALRIKRDIQTVRDAGLIARGRALVEGPLMARHEKLVKRLSRWGRSTVLPISMGLIPFSGTASIGSLFLATVNAERKFAILAATNCAAVFLVTLLFREFVLSELFGLK
jgi:hypothetical protein